MNRNGGVKMELKSIYSLDIQDWQQWLQEHKQPKFRANQIFDWLYKKRVQSIEEMSNLPKDLKALLAESFDFTTLKERKKQIASDGTTKFLFELADGDLIETVLMRHKYGCSVCVTTQVGCRIGCKFCASTLSGLKRNLQAGEIVAQVLRVQQYLDETEGRVSHIVVMGIGEPFENYENLSANQIFDWLYKKRVQSIEEMSNLPKDLKALLAESFDFTTLKERKKQIASDGTTKFLFELADGDLIETVLMRHKYGCSVCVTTQVGCRIGCKFCASTLSGLKRNLQAGEIVAQVLRVQQYLDETEGRVSHIVVMGIGEPFENYENLSSFIHIINNEKGLNIGSRHITVSTSGIVPKIYDFAQQHPQVSFAISLHAPTDELRTQLMPINRAYPLEKLMKAAHHYVEKTNRRVTFEYGLIKNVNDRKQIVELHSNMD